MINLSIGGIIAGIAFILSFLIGLVSGTSMPMLILRPVIFAAAFFVLSGVVYFLLRNFLPELLDGDSVEPDSGLLPGSRINITEGDTPDFTRDFGPSNSPDLSGRPAPSIPRQGTMGAQADDSEDGLGNISDLLGKYVLPQASDEETLVPSSTLESSSWEALDQNAQDGYTKRVNSEETSESARGDSFGAGASLAAMPGGSAGKSARSEHPNPVDILPDLDSMAGAFLSASRDEESDANEFSGPAPSRKPTSGKKTPGWAGDFNAKDMASGLRTILNKEKEG